MALDSPELSVSIGNWQLQNPIMTASGTFGYGEEFADFVDLDSLGGMVLKGISLFPKNGNPPPRVVETSCGMLNAIGLENVGIDKFINEKLPRVSRYKSAIVVNILGDSIDEYRELAQRLNDTDIDAIEVNISCPNVKKGGVAFGTDHKMAYEVTRVVRQSCSKPVIMKLTPNVTDIAAIAQAVEEGGADAVSLINTLLGMAIDVKTRRPRLANTVGGLSGPAIKPVALRMVWQVARKVSIPVIGIGGITTVEDVVEFLLAGASAVQVGTANLVNPQTSGQLVEELADYLKSNNMASVHELIGAMEV
ncbi:MAG: dihydroorotate dehydrogenase [Desulfobulbaceae bacterium]|nr:dihydroorotate dehydrogenase [Desulfobulbaceae bacterium]